VTLLVIPLLMRSLTQNQSAARSAVNGEVVAWRGHRSIQSGRSEGGLVVGITTAQHRGRGLPCSKRPTASRTPLRRWMGSRRKIPPILLSGSIRSSLPHWLTRRIRPGALSAPSRLSLVRRLSAWWEVGFAPAAVSKRQR